MNVLLTQLLIFAGLFVLQWVYYQVRNYLDSRKMWLEFERKVKTSQFKNLQLDRETIVKCFKEIEELRNQQLKK